MKRETGAIVVAILVVASLGAGYLVGSVGHAETVSSVSTFTSQHTETSTQTVTSTVTGNPVTLTSTLNLTVTSTVTSAPPGYVLVNSSVSNGLEVGGLIGPVRVAAGQNITITVWVSNTLSKVVTVNATGIMNPIAGPCVAGLEGAEVYQGNYTASSLPPGGGLYFFNPTAAYSCSTETETQISFSPDSNIATAGGHSGPQQTTSELSGYYAGSGQSYAFADFPPGVYTVRVFDAWGQDAIAHFQVAN